MKSVSQTILTRLIAAFLLFSFCMPSPRAYAGNDKPVQVSCRALLIGFVVVAGLLTISSPGLREFWERRESKALAMPLLGDPRPLDLEQARIQEVTEALGKLVRARIFDSTPFDKSAVNVQPRYFIGQLLAEYSDESSEIAKEAKRLKISLDAQDNQPFVNYLNRQESYLNSDGAMRDVDRLLGMAVRFELEWARENGRSLTALEVVDAMVSRASQSFADYSPQSPIGFRNKLGFTENAVKTIFLGQQATAIRRHFEKSPSDLETLRMALLEKAKADPGFNAMMNSSALSYSVQVPTALASKAATFRAFLGNPDASGRPQRLISLEHLEENQSVVNGWIAHAIQVEYDAEMSKRDKPLIGAIDEEDLPIQKLVERSLQLDTKDVPRSSREDMVIRLPPLPAPRVFP